MKQNQLNNLAKDIIRKNIYLTLGTSDGKEPWTAPLFYAANEKNEFYFISKMGSTHIKHILKNPKISFAIFDSHQKEGMGNGIQGKGIVVKLPENEIKQALKFYKTTFIETKKESFTGKAPYRLFKIIPQKLYILDPDEQTDVRVEVFPK